MKLSRFVQGLYEQSSLIQCFLFKLHEAKQRRSFHEKDKIETTVKSAVEPLYNGHLGDRGEWPLQRGGRYGEVGM